MLAIWASWESISEGVLHKPKSGESMWFRFPRSIYGSLFFATVRQCRKSRLQEYPWPRSIIARGEGVVTGRLFTAGGIFYPDIIPPMFITLIRMCSDAHISRQTCQHTLHLDAATSRSRVTWGYCENWDCEVRKLVEIARWVWAYILLCHSHMN